MIFLHFAQKSGEAKYDNIMGILKKKKAGKQIYTRVDTEAAVLDLIRQRLLHFCSQCRKFYIYLTFSCARITIKATGESVFSIERKNQKGGNSYEKVD